MIPELFEYNRQVNRIFGLCVQVQNTARPLGALAFQMELVARNGVVHAAKLDVDQGRPLGVLTSFLSELPDEIDPIVHRIEEACATLARAIADCTNRIRIYYLQVEGLMRIAGRHQRELPAEQYTRLRSLDSLRGELFLAPLSGTERASIPHVLSRAKDGLRRVGQLVAESSEQIEVIRGCLDELRRTTHMSRYVSQCVRVEVSQISGEAGRFDSFADQVAATVDLLEGRLGLLANLSRDGSLMLSALSDGVDLYEE